MRRWFAIIPDKSFVHEMLPMQKAGKMNSLLDDPTTCDIVGIPTYFDEEGRYWPKCIDGCVIAKMDK